MRCFPRQSRLLLVTVAVISVAGGCGAPPAIVSGTITFRKERLRLGTVQLFTAQGQVFSCLIDEDGAYRLRDVPAGPARLAVLTHPEVPSGLDFPTPAQHPPYPGRREDCCWRRFVRIPERYGQPDRSGLTLTVAAGEQTFDIELQP